MSRYKAYPAYKESGVEWLGRVPEGWKISPVKYCTSHIGSGKTPSGGAEVYQDSGVLFLRSQNIHDNGLRLDDAVYITREVDAEMSWSRVKPNDVLLNITGASIGRSCVAPADIPDANVNQHVCIIRPTDSAISKWVACCFVSQLIQAQIDFSQNGAGREGLNFEQIGKMIILIPPVEDHEIISAHLDRETTRIDGLVEKKTRFIELLREKRQALITHAVTKGLDPNAKMKDSWVEWLGEVPEHWGVSPVKFITKATGGAIKTGPFGSQLTSAEMLGGTVKVYNQKTVIERDIAGGENYISQEKFEQLKAFRVFAGDVLVTTRGTIGRVMIAPDDIEVGILHPCLMRVQANESKITKEFLCWLLGESVLVQAQIAYLSNASTIEVIYSETMASLIIPIPSIDEQLAIIAHLDRETTRIDSLIAKTERSIELLKERRSALITAAVTGQIDLREAA